MRLGILLLITAVGSVLLFALGLREDTARPIVSGAAVAGAWTGIFPSGTPHRWRRNALWWVGLSVYFGGTGLLIDRWWLT